MKGKSFWAMKSEDDANVSGFSTNISNINFFLSSQHI